MYLLGYENLKELNFYKVLYLDKLMFFVKSIDL